MQPRITRFSFLCLSLAVVACGGGDSPSSGVASEAAGAAVSPTAGTPEAPGPVGLDGSGSPASGPGSETPRTAGGAPGSGSAGGPLAGAADPGLPATADAPDGPSAGANDILLRAERAYAQVRSMQAGFVQRVYVPLLETTQHSNGTLYHRSPDRFLMRFADPAGDVIVADGRFVWMYYPSTDDGQVMRAPLAAGGQQADLYREFLSDATRKYAATHDGSESVGGRPAQALTLVPRGASPYSRVRIWVDDQDALVRRFEITEENGTIRHLEMSGLRTNVDLSDTLFRFTPPAGVQIHDF